MEWVVGLVCASVGSVAGFILSACLSTRADEDYCLHVEEMAYKVGHRAGFREGRNAEFKAEAFSRLQNCDEG